MTKPAQAFAEQVAARRGARVVRLPTRNESEAWAVVAPSGAHVLLVQSYAHAFGVFSGKGAYVEPADADAHVDAGWDGVDVTMTEALLAVSEASRQVDSRPLSMSLPSGLREVNLSHGPCYVHANDRGELVVPVDLDYERRPLGVRSDLPALVEWALARMRLQEAASARDVALGENAEAFANEVLARLLRDVPLASDAAWTMRASGGRDSRELELVRGDTGRLTCKVSVWRGAVSVRATGLDVSLADTSPAAVVDAIRRGMSLLSREDLVEDAPYLLLEPFEGRAAGETITYVGNDPRDNHWNLEIFRTRDGATLEVDVNDAVWRRIHEVLRPL